MLAAFGWFCQWVYELNSCEIYAKTILLEIVKWLGGILRDVQRGGYEPHLYEVVG